MELDLGGFLKATDVKSGDLIKILDEGKLVESKSFKDLEGNPKMNYNFRVSLENGAEKTLTINKTSLRMLADKYTNDTKTWIGKLAKVNLGSTSQGKKMIILEPID